LPAGRRGIALAEHVAVVRALQIYLSVQLTVLAALAMLVALNACGGGGELGPDAGPADAAPDPGQGSPARSALVINEVAPDPAAGAADWVEILNRGETPIDLCGVFLTDLADRLDHYHPLGGVLPPDPCPPRLLGPGERLVVVADDGAEPGIDHAGFALGHADEVHLVAIDGLVIDRLLYLLPAGHGGRSLARIPDGEGAFFLAAPTAGAANR
jgi:hypothetical protein